MLGYYDNQNFRNSLYALDLSIETHLANLLFNGDATRIIVADNSNSLRERAKDQEWNSLFLPFLNYYCKKITLDTKRKWFNHILNVDGIWIEELQRKVRLAPIHVSYESSIYFHRNDDTHQAMLDLIFQSSNENLLQPSLQIDGGENLDLLAVMYYNLDFEPDFVQKDWFDKNRIHSITLNFEFDYTYIKDNTTGFGIPEEVVFNYGRIHNLETENYDEIMRFIINRFDETVTPI